MAKSKMDMIEAEAPKQVKDDEIQDYHVEDAARDLMRAEKHKANRKLMKKVHSHLKEQKRQISSIQDLKDMRNEMMIEDKQDGGDLDQMSEKKSKKKAPGLDD